jgi:hypothetical protein
MSEVKVAMPFAATSALHSSSPFCSYTCPSLARHAIRLLSADSTGVDMTTESTVDWPRIGALWRGHGTIYSRTDLSPRHQLLCGVDLLHDPAAVFPDSDDVGLSPVPPTHYTGAVRCVALISLLFHLLGGTWRSEMAYPIEWFILLFLHDSPVRVLACLISSGGGETHYII